MHFKTISITPALAKKMLATGKSIVDEKTDKPPATNSSKKRVKKDNRNISVAYVKRLAQAMERGEWGLNAMPIVLDKKGKVIDGQHRLSAVIIYKKPVRMTIAYGVDNDAIKTIDIGRKRTPADMLSLRGEKDCNVLASAVRLLNSYKEKNMNSVTCNTAYISPLQTEHILGENPGLRESVLFASGNKKAVQLILTPSIIVTFHYIFGRKGAKNRDIFFDSLIGGANLGKNNPIYILRQILLERRVRYSTKDKPMICCLIIKTWNNKFGGTRVDIVYDPAEKMPKVL